MWYFTGKAKSASGAEATPDGDEMPPGNEIMSNIVSHQADVMMTADHDGMQHQSNPGKETIEQH